MRRTSWCALLLAATLARPALAGAREERARPTDIAAVDEFIDAPRALFGRGRPHVERALGAPAAVRERTLADPVGRVEAVDELAYRGVVVYVSRRSAAVRRVVLTEARGPLPRGLNVGTSRVEVERALGEPQLASDGSVLYLYSDAYPDTVEFQFHDGRVRRIEWTYALID